MACCILLDISSVFHEKYYCQNYGDYFCAFWIFRSFPGFFSTCFAISVGNLVYTCSRWCYTSSSSFIPIGTLWPYLTAKNRSKSFICIHGLKNHIEALDLVHTLILWVPWSLLIFVMVGQFLAVWRTKTLKQLVELPASDTWGLSFIRIRSLPLKSFLVGIWYESSSEVQSYPLG